MKRLRCPKCDEWLAFDETKYSAGQSLVFACEHCGKQFSVRLGGKKKLERKDSDGNEDLEDEFKAPPAEPCGHIVVIENVFGYRQELPLFIGENIIGRRCKGTDVNVPIESGDMSMDRRHCMINIKRNKQGNPVFTLRDAPSLTGTFLNNDLLGPKDRIRLDDEAIITCGATTFILHKENLEEE